MSYLYIGTAILLSLILLVLVGLIVKFRYSESHYVYKYVLTRKSAANDEKPSKHFRHVDPET